MMKKNEKITLLRTLSSHGILNTSMFYDIMQKCGCIRHNYHEYALSCPIDCGRELLRLPMLDYDGCCALLTMLLREDHFDNGSFERRQGSGEVKPIVDRMIRLLEAAHEETRPMKKILLGDLLQIPSGDECQVKIRFNQHNGQEDPLDIYLREPERVNTQWLLWRGKQRYFKVGQIAVCLLKLSADSWLLTTVKRITKELGILDGVNYEGEEVEAYRQYFGRVVVRYHKTAQAQCVHYATVCDELEVLQLLPAVYDGEEFPGYDQVRLSHAQLASIIEREKASWIAALENQKAVYLITDRHNGKLYVGSATAERGMLLQRWRSYAENGHGGNKELMEVVQEKGLDYVRKYFQYSILENYNAKVDDHVILKREAWWKETLQSRKFGYNSN